MRLRFLAAASGLLLIGCATTTYREVGFVGLTPGSIEMFSALVPSSDGTPVCETPANPAVGPGERAVALVYPSPARQQITVLIDQAGMPKAYIDVRTDLSDSGGTEGDRTAIALYLNQDYAILSNYPEGETPLILEVPLEQAYSAERLGNPSAMVRRVLDVCGAAI